MKIILNHELPFWLAHGGVTKIVQRTEQVLQELGYEVEPLRWWDEKQSGDILFQFCRPAGGHFSYAKSKGMKIAVEQVLTGLVSRPRWKRVLQKRAKRLIERHAPSMFSGPFNWESFHLADRHFAPSPHDMQVIEHMFDVPAEKIELLPYGVDDEFLNSDKTQPREPWLICTATITERKRVLEIAEAAIDARVPVKIVGKPYGPEDPYYLRFKNAVSRSEGLVEHVNHVSSREQLAQLYAKARGFVLLSTMETVSQSALEAAACGCPMLLSDQDWARSAFGMHASYCPVASRAKTAEVLKTFHGEAAESRQTFPAKSWFEARKKLKDVFEKLIH
jgi:glycosyltransferase involved in cell wall biosynthesis